MKIKEKTKSLDEDLLKLKDITDKLIQNSVISKENNNKIKIGIKLENIDLKRNSNIMSKSYDRNISSPIDKKPNKNFNNSSLRSFYSKDGLNKSKLSSPSKHKKENNNNQCYVVVHNEDSPISKSERLVKEIAKSLNLNINERHKNSRIKPRTREEIKSIEKLIIKADSSYCNKLNNYYLMRKDKNTSSLIDPFQSLNKLKRINLFNEIYHVYKKNQLDSNKLNI